MVSSAATTVANYLSQLPADRRASIERVRAVVNASLPPGYEEGMQYGMIGWYVPLARYPSTYNGQPLCLASLASQKQHLSLYLMTVYGGKQIERFLRAGFLAAGKQLDMGKSCVRFKSADALALDVIGATIAKLSVEQYIAAYENIRGGTKTGAKPKRAATGAKPKPKATAAPKANGKANATARVNGKAKSNGTAKSNDKANDGKARSNGTANDGKARSNGTAKVNSTAKAKAKLKATRGR